MTRSFIWRSKFFILIFIQKKLLVCQSLCFGTEHFFQHHPSNFVFDHSECDYLKVRKGEKRRYIDILNRATGAQREKISCCTSVSDSFSVLRIGTQRGKGISRGSLNKTSRET